MTTRRPGRPSRATTPELTAALVEHQLALARRTAARINGILETHVRRGDVARAWLRIVDRFTRAFGPGGTFEARVLTAIPELGPHRDGLRDLLRDVLRTVPVTDEDRALAALPSEPPEPPAVVRPVEDLAGARAQSARLRARLMDLQARIVPIRDRG